MILPVCLCAVCCARVRVCCVCRCVSSLMFTIPRFVRTIVWLCPRGFVGNLLLATRLLVLTTDYAPIVHMQRYFKVYVLVLFSLLGINIGHQKSRIHHPYLYMYVKHSYDASTRTYIQRLCLLQGSCIFYYITV